MGKSGEKGKAGNNGYGTALYHMTPFVDLDLDSGLVATFLTECEETRLKLSIREPHFICIREIALLCSPEHSYLYKNRVKRLSEWIDIEWADDRSIPQLGERKRYPINRILEDEWIWERIGAGVVFLRSLRNALPWLLSQAPADDHIYTFEVYGKIRDFTGRVKEVQMASDEAWLACAAALDGKDCSDPLVQFLRQQPRSVLLGMSDLWLPQCGYPSITQNEQTSQAEPSAVASVVEPQFTLLPDEAPASSNDKDVLPPVDGPGVSHSVPGASGSGRKGMRKWLAMVALVGICGLFTAAARVGVANLWDVMETQGPAVAANMIFSTDTDEELFTAGWVYYKATRYDDSFRLATQLVDSEDRHMAARGHWLSGAVLNKKVQPEAALSELTLASAHYNYLNNEDGVYRSNVEIANARRLMDQPEKAINILDNLIPITEHSIDYKQVKGLTLFDLGFYEASRKVYREILPVESAIVKADIYAHLGLCHILEGNLVDGNRLTRKSRTLLLNTPVPLTTMLNALNDYAESLALGEPDRQLVQKIRQWAEKHQDRHLLRLFKDVEQHFADKASF